MLRYHLAWLLLFPLCALSDPKIVPQLAGGINKHDAAICLEKIKSSQCRLNTQLTQYKFCVKKVLKEMPACKQTAIFFKLTDGDIPKKIRTYENLDVVLASYDYISEQGASYFIITKRGQLIALPLRIKKKALTAMPNYKQVAKNHLNVNAWQIMDFPEQQYLANKRYRLIFKQQLKDGCDACPIVGVVRVGHDFSRDGTQFYGMKVLELIPN